MIDNNKHIHATNKFSKWHVTTYRFVSSTGVLFLWFPFMIGLSLICICLFTGQIVSICPGQCGKVPDREIWRCWDNKGCHCTQRTGKLLFIIIMNLCLTCSLTVCYTFLFKEISVQHMQTCKGQAFLCPCQSNLTCTTPHYLPAKNNNTCTALWMILMLSPTHGLTIQMSLCHQWLCPQV